METAGQNSAALIFSLSPQAKTAIVLCGPGNNGGDGFVVARELQELGIQVQVVAIAGPSELRNKKRSEFSGPVQTAEAFLSEPRKADLWVDALFGIGLDRDLQNPAKDLINWVNQSEGIKISLDTPSGLNVDTGTVMGTCFQAHITITVGQHKPGFYLNQGPENTGLIKTVDAGFSQAIVKKEARSVFLMNRKLAGLWLPKRKSTDNKTAGGRSLIWAGNPSMPGAAILACEAASRVGSGYVYSSENEVVRSRPEVIPWKSNDFQKISSVLLGPGLGFATETFLALQTLAKQQLPAVIDADALTMAAEKKFKAFQKNWILTPHAGELSRLLNISAKEIESDRLKFSKIAQQEFQSVILLKGFHTVVAYPKFSVIIPTGNAALAKGGSGDVLGGMIAGFLSQNVSYERAPLLAGYIHGLIADHWLASGKDLLSLTPQDLLNEIPLMLKKIRKS